MSLTHHLSVKGGKAEACLNATATNRSNFLTTFLTTVKG